MTATTKDITRITAVADLGDCFRTVVISAVDHGMVEVRPVLFDHAKDPAVYYHGFWIGKERLKNIIAWYADGTHIKLTDQK